MKVKVSSLVLLIICILSLDLSGQEEVPLELFSDVIIFRRPASAYDPPCYAQIGSLRLAQKLNLKVGDNLAQGNCAEVIQKAIDALEAGGKILFKRGNYRAEIKLPFPSYFIFEGEGSTIWGQIGFKGEKFSKSAILEIRDLSFNFEKPNEPGIHVCQANHVIIQNTRSQGGKDASHIQLEGCQGMKLVEFHCYAACGSNEAPCLDVGSKFCTVINPECFGTPPGGGARFGPGGMFIGGHFSTGKKGITTHPLLDEHVQKCYPSTVVAGSPEGQETCYTADGAYLILLYCARSSGKQACQKINNGKIIMVGEELEQ